MNRLTPALLLLAFQGTAVTAAVSPLQHGSSSVMAQITSLVRSHMFFSKLQASPCLLQIIKITYHIKRYLHQAWFNGLSVLLRSSQWPSRIGIPSTDVLNCHPLWPVHLLVHSGIDRFSVADPLAIRQGFQLDNGERVLAAWWAQPPNPQAICK